MKIKDKIKGYEKFWKREKVERPLIGYDVGGYHPFKRFKAMKELQGNKYLKPDLLEPARFMNDYNNFYQESTEIDDDLIKGVTPIPAIPWMEAILGCPIEISGESIWAKERKADWDELENLEVSDDNRWLNKYLEFLDQLKDNAEGEYPVGPPILRGISDLIGALRGHTEALIDCLNEPEKIKELAARCTDAFIKVNKKQYEVIEPFHGGYFIEQFSIWAPDKIIRMQNDATSVYSPSIYSELIQEYDRKIASAFPYTLIHLHSSSFFLLDYFLEIEEINLFEMNKDVGAMSMEEMLPYLQQVQDNDRCLLIRGKLDEEDLKLIKEELSPAGLSLQIVQENTDEALVHWQTVKQIF